MEARTSRVILLLLLQAVLLQSVQALSVHERRSQYVMNQNAITWHESCNAINPQNNQETRRAAVERAWEGALELISSARTRFETVTWPRINKGELDSNAQNYINIHDPAYVLLFALESSEDGREEIQIILNNLYMRVNTNPGENGREDDGFIQLRCSDEFEVDGIDHCKTDVAATDSSDERDTSVINFCPVFWKLPRFDQLKSGDPMGVLGWYHDKDYLGTDALTVVHEVTHIWWIGETNDDVPEVYAYVNCAEQAWGKCGSPVPNNTRIYKNAETYALYAESGSWEENGIRNLWPSNIIYPVRLPVQNY